MEAKDIVEYRKKNGLTQEEFAQLIGVSKNTIYNYENGSVIPKTKIPKLKEILEKVSHNIAIEENKNSIYNQIKNIEHSSIEQEDPRNGVDIKRTDIAYIDKQGKSMYFKDGATKPVPYFNIDFAGGWDIEEIFSIPFPDFYIINPEFDKSEFACNLVGNSVSQIIKSGSIIGLREIHDWQTYFPTNELYGIVMKNGLRTVKLVKRSKDKKQLILMPIPLEEHNRGGYEPDEVPIEFVSKFYQVIAWAFFERLSY